MSLPLLSFFTGGGFLDIGFMQAGFNIVWTNEFNDTFANLYEHAMPNIQLRNRGPVRCEQISCRESVVHLDGAVVKRKAFPAVVPQCFGVIGGPPCPDFSMGGRNDGRHGENGKLTKIFAELIGELAPTFFVIENVPGLLRTRKHSEYLHEVIAILEEDFGYAVDYCLLNALHFGAPQDRERLFIVGVSRSFLEKKMPNHSASSRGWFSWPKPVFPDAKDLPWPAQIKFGRTPPLPDNIPMELMTFSVFGQNSDPEFLPNGLNYFQPYSAKFWNRAEGDVSGKSFKRLHRYRYSPTVWYGNNEVHLHPWKPRRLSVREALRLQTVPDTYILPEDAPLSAKFKLVGNGVPCVLAEHLGNALKDFLLNESKTTDKQIRPSRVI